VKLTEAKVRWEVAMGNYQIGIIIPEGATHKIRKNINLMVARTMSGIGMINPALATALQPNDSVEINIFFDPAVKQSFRIAVLSSMKEFRSKIEASMIFQAFNREICRMFPVITPEENSFKDMVSFREIYPSGKAKEIVPTTTQHNVPAWAVFAMFFIVIPLTSSMIQEREQGHLVRIMNLPVNYVTIFMAKVGVYLIVCFIQFILMILAGIYFLPLFGIPPLDLGSHYFALFVMAFTTGLAALGYGILIGTIARTHQQSAAFGSVSVIIMAALGGLWVPVYLMPGFMRQVAVYSPLNWALTGFYDIFLRGAEPWAIFRSAMKLFIFFAVSAGIAGLYRKIKPPISA
ncbi:MAG: ABC transporter permease, partial [Bacteroidota bacterium]|nr:ABC transporter permease [Bacteroidota bacterium]